MAHPWHGVAVLEGERFRLMKRHEAEAAGAEVVEVDGRPMHLELPVPPHAEPVAPQP